MPPPWGVLNPLIFPLLSLLELPHCALAKVSNPCWVSNAGRPLTAKKRIEPVPLHFSPLCLQLTPNRCQLAPNRQQLTRKGASPKELPLVEIKKQVTLSLRDVLILRSLDWELRPPWLNSCVAG